jgi:uncharacterized membrane protein YedE/YeeE
VKALLSVFFSGLVFAIGLGLSGMTDANKVIAFLNAASGKWDPSLAFVMVGAIGAHWATFKWVTGRPSPLFAAKFYVPMDKNVDTRLVVGSGLFGIGWGLGGFCPGPGVVSTPTGAPMALAFVGALLAGMVLFAAFHKHIAASSGKLQKEA